MQIVAYSDGYCKGNGKNVSKAGGSYAAYFVEQGPIMYGSSVDHATIAEKGELLFHVTHEFPHKQLDCTLSIIPYTNNLAEAVTCNLLLQELNAFNYLTPKNNICICLDSELILNQILGIYKCNMPSLKKVYKNIDAVLSLAQKKCRCTRTELFRNLLFTWIPGDEMKKTIIQH